VTDEAMNCPLCGCEGPMARLVGPLGLGYRLCPRCALISMEPEALPDPETERARYSTHRNGPQYPGHVAFLRRAIDPTLSHLQPGARGLDYGCGPVPTLSVVLRAEGYACEDYDPLFLPELPQGPFDVVFATEVVEHLHRPAEELVRIVGLLRPGGLFTMMTEPWTEVAAFGDWYYARDPTHVCFYHERTIDFICAAYGLALVDHPEARVWVLRKG
jgi:SAM-dependent methyltransferase